MRIASVAEIKSRFSAFLKASEEGPVIVTRNGKPVAVLLNVADEDEMGRLVLAYSPRFRSLLELSRKHVLGGKGVSHDEFWEKLEPADPKK